MTLAAFTSAELLEEVARRLRLHGSEWDFSVRFDDCHLRRFHLERQPAPSDTRTGGRTALTEPPHLTIVRD